MPRGLAKVSRRSLPINANQTTWREMKLDKRISRNLAIHAPSVHIATGGGSSAGLDFLYLWFEYFVLDDSLKILNLGGIVYMGQEDLVTL
jgi:hypothetical protein